MRNLGLLHVDPKHLAHKMLQDATSNLSKHVKAINSDGQLAVWPEGFDSSTRGLLAQCF